LACGGSEGNVRILDLDRHGARPKVLEEQPGPARGTSYSRDGRRIAFGESLGVWDLSVPDANRFDIKRPGGAVLATAFSPDGSSLFMATRWWGHRVRLDGTDPTSYSSRPFPAAFSADSPTALRPIGESADHLQVALLTASDTVSVNSLNFDGYEATAIQGDPGRLLDEWLRRLGLKITADGDIDQVD
jgi:hypothetical protein